MVVIAARAVVVRRGQRRLLNRVDVAVEAGRLTAVLGPNGAGKSTLLRCLSGALKPDEGAVLLDGRPVGEMAPGELARRRAVLGQESRLAFGFSVAEVVALGRIPHAGHSSRHDDLRAAAEAMRVAGVLALAERAFTTLSGGEKQRVHLARTLCQLWPFDRPGEAAKLLLLDEPTNNLDLAHQHGVLGHARALAAAGLAVVVVLHEPNLAALYADRVVVLSDGEVVVDGPPRAALSAELLSTVYGLELRRFEHPDHAAPLLVAAAIRRQDPDG